VLDLDHHELSADKVRALLRKLRDLNLCSGPVAISRQLRLCVAGCLSLDAPAESGVRYLVRDAEGRQTLLEIDWQPDGLRLSAGGLALGSARKRIDVQLACDRQGRVCARELGARVRADSTDRRELEHFLRRILRTLYCNP
jgi:hypothetical protein